MTLLESYFMTSLVYSLYPWGWSPFSYLQTVFPFVYWHQWTVEPAECSLPCAKFPLWCLCSGAALKDRKYTGVGAPGGGGGGGGCGYKGSYLPLRRKRQWARFHQKLE